MSSPNLPVIAAIPAYNEEAVIGGLLSTVLEQNYDEVYVLDDCSIDNTIESARSFGADVKVVQGRENLGSGGNRNRLLSVLSKEAIIHFLDADVELLTPESVQIARELGSIANIGFVSGLITLPNGSPHIWNYGPAYSIPQQISSWVYPSMLRIAQVNKPAGNFLRLQANRWPLVEQWPDPLHSPTARDIFWGTEANMVIPFEVFKRVGGYDERFRYHEVMELAIRLDRLGLIRRFDPAIEARHKDLDWLNKGYSKEYWQGLYCIAKEIGLKQLLLGYKPQVPVEPLVSGK